ncbi:LysE family translocator [Massilia sp. BJB1822]|uniref:LysE family translocator n=1 Tax=Massilia sp. BJB1822 TaxID=2744470 RepID=UPI001592D4AA|nr:LysE family transporter [Massilia sp. BJB1822]NVE01456.1 LysE family transporter [Massilia sp. BJB1822]
MTFALWLTFLCLALAASFSPGPGVLLAISTTMALGARRTVYSSVGNAVGVFLVSCVAVSGVGLMVQRSPLAFSVLKLAGAAYLAWLGVKQWRGAGKGAQAAVPNGQAVAHTDSRYAVFRRGLLVASSNPKAILFFSAVFPQFMPPGELDAHRFLLLSLTFVGCTFVSHLSYVLLAASAGARFLTGGGMVRLQRGTALLFIALAFALAR